jgi:pimeloyl-ACP methyl ester carboxylesterase
LINLPKSIDRKMEIYMKETGYLMKILIFIRKILIIAFSLLFITVGSGIIYEAVSEWRDLKNYPAPGKIIKIDGHEMHIYSEGQGSETIVFVSGWGIECPFVEYSPIYSKLSQYTRITVYDRPGYGWSEISNTSRDIDTVSKELHKLLELSGEKPPYILVGHSMASLELIRFAQLYPNEVKGIVMMDAGNPDFYASQETIQGNLSSNKLIGILQKTGVMRLLFTNDNFMNSVYASRNQFMLISPEMIEMDKALYLINLTNKNKIDEIKLLYDNAKTVAGGGNLGNIPLLLLTAENSDPDYKINTEWIKSQQAFLEWSNNSEMEIVKNGNHYFYQFSPEKVVEMILKICE